MQNNEQAFPGGPALIFGRDLNFDESDEDREKLEKMLREALNHHQGISKRQYIATHLLGELIRSKGYEESTSVMASLTIADELLAASEPKEQTALGWHTVQLSNPLEPGWYWHREPCVSIPGPRIIRVKDGYYTSNTIQESIDRLEGEVLGPIEEPK